MKTLLTAYRVQDLARSLAWYAQVGFREIGRVSFEDGSVRAMLNLPGDGDVVTIELFDDGGQQPVALGTGFSHIAVQVDDLAATLADLVAQGVAFEEPQRPGGEDGPRTCFLRDPDGYQFELVQWPPGHPDGMTRADFP
ncbi:MAG: VOC family protein [Thermomicrobiales bacterium]